MSTLEHEGMLRRGRLLETFTIVWNSAEGLISIGLGLLAGSIALIGFGADSFIETASGAVLSGASARERILTTLSARKRGR